MTHDFDDHPDLNEALAVYLEAAEAGTPLDRQEWLARYPALADELLAFLDDLHVVDQAVTPLRQAAEAGGGADVLDRAWHVPVQSKRADQQQGKTGPASPPEQRGQTAATIDEGQPERQQASPVPLPRRIAHFRIEQVLGKGGCGIVYLAWDEKLNRLVAIKVPHADLVARPGAADAYLKEARTVASLEHPNIVPVYQADGTADFPCYIVSKYIDGSDLAQLMARALLPLGEIIRVTAMVAETLHYAHGEGVVHRDIKPGNILLDGRGTPFVTDFGLALREQDVGKGPRYLGTPVYMSPEQARGEGHRVDGRSDVFSLGVVLYELLTGRRPFHGASEEELLEQIISREVRPPRQWDDTLPHELERICLKALAKRASDRYTTAKDFADDLRQFLASAPSDPRFTAALRERNEAAAVTPVPSPAPTPVDTRPLKVVPRGLRSFDAGDADFFLELLPGPRDREGLPESIRFWKSRIEETDGEKTFSVGLIYGPSGSGKSSLMKAGLLPRLADHVIPLYVEATADDTESRVLGALRKRYPTLVADPESVRSGRIHAAAPQPGEPGHYELKDALTALRRGQNLPAGKKVLLVLDQFEQWLHGWKIGESADLLQALRQCDGAHVQCLLMVRADFWVAVSTFLKALEVSDGSHVGLVDRFDLDHARKVLTAFGRALGKLPEHASDLTKDQEQFLQQALAGLAEDNKVISVRLALFADMMKAKPWTSATLKEMGGTEGVGVRFLEDTFTSPTANPLHRRHEKAARAVLQALLPDAATDIKGHLRPASDLVAASGYAHRPKDFDDLLHILDRELHLITPADPEEKDEGGRMKDGERRINDASSVSSLIPHPSSLPDPSSLRHYQLTHDYLVPDLRAWLTRKQKETRRGRAELLLADRAAVWNARPMNRQLPSLPEWLRISFLTARKTLTAPQRKMMRRATRYHATRWLTIAAVLALLVWGGYEIHGRMQTHALYARLLDADTDKVPTIIADMAPYRRWLNPWLEDHFSSVERADRRRLRIGLAMPLDKAFSYLREQLLAAEPQDIPVIRDALAPRKQQLVSPLWKVVKGANEGAKRRLRAAAALASYDPQSPKWADVMQLPPDMSIKVAELVVNDLVSVPPEHLLVWTEMFRPARAKLLPALAEVYRHGATETQRALATSLVAAYADDRLVDLLLDGDPWQFRTLFPKVKHLYDRDVFVKYMENGIEKWYVRMLVPEDREWKDTGLALLTTEVKSAVPSTSTEFSARRHANAGIALLMLGYPRQVWPLFRQAADPTTRSYLIHRLGPCGADPKVIIRQLYEDKDASSRRALVLALGAFTPDQLRSGPGSDQLLRGDEYRLLTHLDRLYLEDPDPGLHAATEWILCQRVSKGKEKVQKVKQTHSEKSTQRLAEIAHDLAKGDRRPRWYVNGQAQTLVLIPPPGEFQMGSGSAKADGVHVLRSHAQKVERAFAIATTPVTVEQFERFSKEHGVSDIEDPVIKAVQKDRPAVGVSWYQAAAYCNWLNEREHISPDQWCYDIVKGGKIVKPRADFLTRTGYRLPIEAEWEYACRAGTVTSRYYGESDKLLEKYAWFHDNSADHSQPVGSLKPNDLGLFDMQGNVWNWCHDRFEHEGDEERHILRGGSFRSVPSLIDSSGRTWLVPTERAINVGFRVARTIPRE